METSFYVSPEISPYLIQHWLFTSKSIIEWVAFVNNYYKRISLKIRKIFAKKTNNYQKVPQDPRLGNKLFFFSYIAATSYTLVV